MKLIAFSPYGSLREETAVVYMLASYLRPVCSNVRQISCNGVFSLCDRDAQTGWKRSLLSCLSCMREQMSLAEWSGLGEEMLSRFLSQEMVQDTKRWVATLSADSLATATYEGRELAPLWRGSFAKRFGSPPDLRHKLHETYMRRLLLATVRMILASREALTTLRPDLQFVVEADDTLSHAYLLSSDELRVPTVRFRWDEVRRVVSIQHPENKEIFPCEILLDSVSSMRADVKTWPPQLMGMVEEIVSFLGLAEAQLQLPIAQ